MSVPNVSEGVDQAKIERIGAAFAPAHLLDVHSDPDHHRSVFTLAAEQGVLAEALARGAEAVHAEVAIDRHAGIHPHVGAVDVVPVVYVAPGDQGAACAEALTAAELIARVTHTPVFLYGALAGGRERAEIRAGGIKGLAERMASGEHKPDFGPSELHPSGGATLVSARPPMVAFNVDLAPGESLERAKQIASELRESGGGPVGVRAIGLYLGARERAQVSCNVHDPFAVPLAEIVGFVRERADVCAAELVGLAPSASMADFPSDVELINFDSQRHLLEPVIKELS